MCTTKAPACFLLASRSLLPSIHLIRTVCGRGGEGVHGTPAGIHWRTRMQRTHTYALTHTHSCTCTHSLTPPGVPLLCTVCGRGGVPQLLPISPNVCHDSARTRWRMRSWHSYGHPHAMLRTRTRTRTHALTHSLVHVYSLTPPLHPFNSHSVRTRWRRRSWHSCGHTLVRAEVT